MSTRLSRRPLRPPIAMIVLAVGLIGIAVVAVLISRRYSDSDDDRVVELETPPDLRNGRAYIQSNLWIDGPRRYGVWIASDGQAYAGVRDGDGSWQIVDLATIPGNPFALPTKDDLHNAFVIGVDGDGYIHVMGNGHASDHHYARSRQPHDLTSLTAASIPSADGRVTYSQLVPLPDGTLLFFRRHGVSGDAESRIDRLVPGSQEWEHIGTLIDGAPTEESAYIHDVVVDPDTGTVHLVATWRQEFAGITTNDVMYARSSDGGETWATSDGAELELPITHDTAEIIIDTEPRASGLVNHGGLVLDDDGNPNALVWFRPDGGDSHYVWVHHDGDGWKRETVAERAGRGRPELVADGDRLWMLTSSDDDVIVEPLDSDSSSSLRAVGPVPVGWEPVVGSNGLADGVLEMIVPDGERPVIVEIPLSDLP